MSLWAKIAMARSRLSRCPSSASSSRRPRTCCDEIPDEGRSALHRVSRHIDERIPRSLVGFHQLLVEHSRARERHRPFPIHRVDPLPRLAGENLHVVPIRLRRRDARREIEPEVGRVGDAVRHTPVEHRGSYALASRHVLVDRSPKQQVQEQRWIAVRGPGAPDRPLFLEDLSRGLTDATDIGTELVEDRRLPGPWGSSDDETVRLRDR